MKAFLVHDGNYPGDIASLPQVQSAMKMATDRAKLMGKPEATVILAIGGVKVTEADGSEFPRHCPADKLDPVTVYSMTWIGAGMEQPTFPAEQRQ